MWIKFSLIKLVFR